MQNNMGSTDKKIRLILAAIFTFLYFTDVIKGTWGLLLLLLSAIFFLTSLIGYCPLYALLGIKSCSNKK
jgi:hypothetical protein